MTDVRPMPPRAMWDTCRWFWRQTSQPKALPGSADHWREKMRAAAHAYAMERSCRFRRWARGFR